MADRVSFQGQTQKTCAIEICHQGRGAGRGGGRGGLRGSSKSHGGPAQPTLDKPRREAILDLSKYVNEKIRVKFTGGREGVC